MVTEVLKHIERRARFVLTSHARPDGDGVRRGLSNNAEVLIGGKRYPLVGTVSMDNITVDLGPEPAVTEGDEAVLI